MSENGHKEPYGTHAERARQFIRDHLEDLTRTLLSGERSGRSWAKEAGVHDFHFTKILPEFGLEYRGKDHGWALVQNREPIESVEADPDLEKEDKEEIVELITRQARVIQALVEEIKKLRAEKEQDSQERVKLTEQVEDLHRKLNAALTDATKWRDEKKRTRLFEIQAARAFGLESVDAGMRILGK